MDRIHEDSARGSLRLRGGWKLDESAAAQAKEEEDDDVAIVGGDQAIVIKCPITQQVCLPFHHIVHVKSNR